MAERENPFFEKANSKEYRHEKVVEGVFVEPDEIIDANFEEQAQHNPFNEFNKVNLQNSFLMRLLSFLIFALALLFCFFSLALVVISCIKALYLRLGNWKNWYTPIERSWSYFRRTLVVVLSGLVGVFHPQFGLMIFLVYFSLIEPVPTIVEDILRRQ